MDVPSKVTRLFAQLAVSFLDNFALAVCLGPLEEGPRKCLLYGGLMDGCMEGQGRKTGQPQSFVPRRCGERHMVLRGEGRKE